MAAIVTYETQHGSAKRVAEIISKELGCKMINVDTPFEAEDPKLYDDLIVVFNFRGPYTAQLTKLFLSKLGSQLRNRNLYVVGEGLFSEKEFPVVAEEIHKLVVCRNFNTFFIKGQLRTATLYPEERALLKRFSEITKMEIKDMGELDVVKAADVAKDIHRFSVENVPSDKEEYVQIGPKRWRCLLCGYIHEGDNPPDKCPLCGTGKENFELI